MKIFKNILDIMFVSLVYITVFFMYIILSFTMAVIYTLLFIVTIIFEKEENGIREFE